MNVPISWPTIDAVVITRGRPDLLRKTLTSIQESTIKVDRIIVADDGTDTETARMLATEFPTVLRIDGPRRGISANRNLGLTAATSECILLSDNDMLLDPHFLEAAIEKVATSQADVVFAGTSDDGVSIFPNALGFLGFADRAYKPGEPYVTANGQCFLLTRHLAQAVKFDEVISVYGYEEMDYFYRVAAAGFRLVCVPTCVNVHLNPNSHFDFRAVQDASRLYVTFKRALLVDKSSARAALFLIVAIPHHVLASYRRDGRRGILQAMTNVALAFEMYSTLRKTLSPARSASARRSFDSKRV